jgi:hypothetical protein
MSLQDAAGSSFAENVDPTVLDAPVTYGFRKGSRVSGVSPQTVGEELDSIKSTHGKLDAPLVVELARDESHPLHSCFEWDNGKAGEEYRKHQARCLINATVIITKDEGALKEFPAYISIRKEGKSTYRTTAQVLSNEEDRQQTLARALQEAQSWQTRYAHLTELGSIFKAIEATKL